MSVMTTAEMLQAIEKEEWLRGAQHSLGSFSAFCKQAWPHLLPGVPLQWSWFHDAICEHMEALFRGEIHRIVINIGPGHSKSTLISVMFQPWCWIHKPYYRWLCSSNNIGLAVRDNGEARRLIGTEWYQTCFGDRYRLSDDQNTKTFYQNDKSGYRAIAAVKAKTTGKRADGLIIDDPHDAMEGEKDRLAALEWFANSWTQRLNDQEFGMMAVVGQRIHDLDLTGHILKNLYGWEHLCLPEEFEPDRKCSTSLGWEDPRTEPGELLWPEKMPRAVVNSLKSSMGSFGFSAQYQQSPVPASGGTFKKAWLRYFTELDDIYLLEKIAGPIRVMKSECWRFSTVDLAISSKQTADYTVIQTYDVTPQNDLLLIDQERGHFDNPQQQKIIRAIYMRLRPLFFKIESTGYQLALIQQLKDTPIQPGDFLVEVGNPLELESILGQMGWFQAFLVRDDRGNYIQVEGGYVVRVQGDQNYFRYAMEKQGYCRVVRQYDNESLHAVSIPVREYKPVRDKVSRASVAAIQMENEKIQFKQGAAYLTDLLPEILMFPLGSHDDQIDPMSMACDELVFPTNGGPIPILRSGEGARVYGLAEQYASLPEGMNEIAIERQQQVSTLLSRLRGGL